MKTPNQKAAKPPKYFPFFLQMGELNIAWTSHSGLHTCSSILYGAVHDPIAFSQLRSLTKCWQPCLTQKLWHCLGRHFLHLYTCKLTASLSNNTKLLLKIAELEIQSVPEHGIKELVCALYCQSNEALEKTYCMDLLYLCSFFTIHV